MKSENNTRIIVLAAGKSTRMKSDIPKALMPFQGKAFIEHILDTIKKLNLNTKPVIVIGHKKELIKETLGNDQVYALQEEQLGTGHAVLSAKNAVGSTNDTILVMATDQPLVSKKTLESLLKKHLEKKVSLTIGTVTVPDFADWRMGLYHFGRIVRGVNGTIEKIVEFKDANDEEKNIKELNPALYVFDAKWLWDNIDKLKNHNAQGEYYLTDLVKMACDENEKIESVQIENIHEALQPNCQEDLLMLEKVTS